MTTAATGVMGVNVQELEERLAASSTFQTKVGVATDALAKNYILYPFGDTAPLAPPRPGALIEEEVVEIFETSGGGSQTFLRRGALRLTLWALAEPESDRKESYIQFRNFADDTIQDMAATAGEDDNIWVSSFRQEGPATLDHPATREDQENYEPPFWEVEYLIIFGAGVG